MADNDQESRTEIFKRYADRSKGDVQRILSTVEGRRFLWRILCEGRIHHSCFDLNALEMAKREGTRDLALFVEGEILKAKPEALELMRAEAASDRLIREAELSKTQGDTNA